MTLRGDVQSILQEFETASSDKIYEVLGQIQEQLKSDITRDYLESKIQGIKDAKNEAEKKKLCKALIPYLDWYLQGS